MKWLNKLIGMEISTSVPDEWYWQFREKAASNQQTESEQLRELVADFIGKDNLAGQNDPLERDEEFGKAVQDRFNLGPFNVQTQNVVAVATRMKQGFTWNEAVKATAEAAKHARDVDDGYEKTVRAQCTRDLELSTEEFKQDIEDLINQHDD